MLVLGLAFAIPWLGPFTAAFGFVPLPLGTLAAIVAILVGYIVATEAAKAWFYRAAPETRRVNRTRRERNMISPSEESIRRMFQGTLKTTDSHKSLKPLSWALVREAA